MSRHTPRRPRLLLVMQTPDADAGRCGRKLRQRGYRLDYCYPLSGQPLPAGMDGYAGAVVFGGPMSANDSTDFIRREVDWIAVPLKEGKPFLGICLGAQMLAPPRRQGGRPPGRQGGGRLLPTARDRTGARTDTRVAALRLPVAPRGVRSSGQRRAAR